MEDFSNSLLQSPLDTSHLEDAGELDTGVKNKFTFANNNLVKKKPDLSVFRRTGPVTRASLVEFVSPYQRFTLLKPYLDNIEKQQGDGDDNTKETGEKNIRMDSIKAHFEKLTEMTPKRVEKKAHVEEEEEEEDVALSSDEEVEPKKPYFENPKKPYVESTERIPNMRQGAQKKQHKHEHKKGNKEKNGEDGQKAKDCNKDVEKKWKNKGENGHRNKQNLKRKGGEPDVVKQEKLAKKEPKEFDYNNVDFKNYGHKNSQNKDFDPNNAERDKKKFIGGKKKQQFNKRGARSHTFKKSE